MAGKLTAKQQTFVEEYLIDLNATQAAIRAGYSKKTAYSIGSELLKKPEIQEAIQKAKADRSKRTQVTSDMVVAELAKIGFSDLRNCLTSSGQLVDPQDWDDNTAGAISSLEVVANTRGGNGDENEPIDYTHKIKTWDKNSALEKLGKHLGMYIDRSEVKVEATIEVESPKDKLKGFLDGVSKRGGKAGKPS